MSMRTFCPTADLIQVRFRTSNTSGAAMLTVAIAFAVFGGCSQEASNDDETDAAADMAEADSSGGDAAQLDVDKPECTVSADCIGKVDAPACFVPSCLAGKSTCGLAEVPEGTACEDNNACTSGAKCGTAKDGSHTCIGQHGSCDDANPCTDDSCDKANGCSNAPNKVACDDGKKCTTDDACADGSCKGGKKLPCDDKNPCTDNLCAEPNGCANPPNDELCDDGSACTEKDACKSGKCAGGAAPSCDDDNPCTDDGCDPKTGCTHLPHTKECDDSNACTTQDTCKSSKCTGVAITCNDNNPCTNDDCDAGGKTSAGVENGCKHAANNAPCDDDNPCTTGDACAKSACSGAGELTCDDGNVCTDDSCDAQAKSAKTACVHLPNSATCTDGNSCTTGDTCAKGSNGVAVCVQGKNQCDCTSDADCKKVDDGNSCNGTVFCDKAKAPFKCRIKPGSTVVCKPSSVACRVNVCDAKTGDCGLTNGHEGKGCEDGNICTLKDTCKGGACLGVAADCDDNKICTIDNCIKASGGNKGGCVHGVIDGAACDDKDNCTQGDACKGGFCIPGNKTSCDDNKACTKDACDAKSGKCSYVAIQDGSPCDDDSKCTKSSSCKAGACVGTTITCDDGNSCTKDLCTPATGCNNAPFPGLCNDGDSCTAMDICQGGKCVGGQAKKCDDGDACTADACSKGKCVFKAGLGPCDDGIVCTVSDTCAKNAAGMATCAGKPENKKCADASACTTDACDPQLGCLHTPSGACSGCKGIACLACAKKKPCTKKNVVPGTCCEIADPLIYLGKGNGDEVVDVEVIGDHAYMCGGFGIRISNVKDPAKPFGVNGGFGFGPQRCQRTGAGAKLGNGTQVIYISHHGDDWVKTPFLGTYYFTKTQQLKEITTETDDKLLFEGMRWYKDHLYVMVHTNGVRVYTTNSLGVPKYSHTVGGFSNAWKMEIIDKSGYVADAEGGVRVVDLGTPAKPKIIQSVKTSGMARDLDGHDKRVFVAMGGAGIGVYKRDVDGKLKFEFNTSPDGSAQAVSYDNGLLAAANWTHSAMYDAGTLQLLATEKVKNFPGFEQDFGIFLRDGVAYVGEWEGVHTLKYTPGRVAPDMWIGDELLTFATGKGLQSRVVIVRNRGLVELQVKNIKVPAGQPFKVDKKAFKVPPGGAASFEVTFTGKGAQYDVQIALQIFSNDPDSYQNPYRLYLVAKKQSGQVNVGDPVPSKMVFLGLDGTKYDMTKLKGKVVVLAYFALF